jgi:ADP-ribose pyrophosphatase YjhB (NUDIX family)
MDKNKRPNVGIGIFMFNSTKDKFLIGKRKKENLYGLPGGALEFGEQLTESAKREIFEETNIQIIDETRIITIGTFNVVRKEINYHWFNIIMNVDLSEEEEGQIKNNEEDKCEEWIWFNFEDLMTNWDVLFYSLQDFIKDFKIKSLEDIRKLKSV